MWCGRRMKATSLLIIMILSSCVSPNIKVKGHLIGNGRYGSSAIITQGGMIHIDNGEVYSLESFGSGVFEINAVLKTFEADNGIWGEILETPEIFEPPASKALKKIGAKIYGKKLTFKDQVIPGEFIEYCNQLPFIQEIDFIRGSVVCAILPKLKFVTKINFDNVNFKGEDLGSLFEIPSLKELTIRKGKNIGSMRLSESSEIEYFHFDHGVIESSLFRKMPKLKGLFLSHIEVVINDSNDFYSLAKLESLLLYDCKEFVILNNDFSKFKQLRDLAIRAQITSDEIHSLPLNLEDLDLSRTLVDDSLIKILPSKLINLDLKSTAVTDELIKNLPVSLESLVIDKTKITSDCIDDLTKLKNLKYLNFNSVMVDFKKIWKLANTVKTLNRINFNENIKMTGAEEEALYEILDSRLE